MTISRLLYMLIINSAFVLIQARRKILTLLRSRSLAHTSKAARLRDEPRPGRIHSPHPPAVAARTAPHLFSMRI